MSAKGAKPAASNAAIGEIDIPIYDKRNSISATCSTKPIGQLE